MRSFWRPERRNRTIGTAAAGRSRSNRMSIPDSNVDRQGRSTFYYERISNYQVLGKTVGSTDLTVIYEKPRDGFSYGSTPADVIRLLSSASKHVSAFPDIITFRQPTAKQALLAPVWGRLLYFAEIGDWSGSAVVLEAQRVGGVLKWPKSIGAQDRAEYDRLIGDGHKFEEHARHNKAVIDEAALRNTILYRTLLHEIGHWVHFHRDVLDPVTALDKCERRAREVFFSRPASEREAFAHAFSQRTKDALESEGAIPFDCEPWPRLE